VFYTTSHEQKLRRYYGKKYISQLLREQLAFMGGTALHKLFLKTQVRYSEDIDLV